MIMRLTPTLQSELLYDMSYGSRWFKRNGESVVTDKYLFADNVITLLPQNGELSHVVQDKERLLASNDEMLLTLTEDTFVKLDRGIHKLTVGGGALAYGNIQSGDTISYTTGAVYKAAHLAGDKFIINKIVWGSPDFVVESGFIKSGDLVRLESTSENYPDAPTGYWDGTWPWFASIQRPIYPKADGTIRVWGYPDPLPTGPICLYGRVGLARRVTPVSIDSNGVWYNIDGTLWTSQLSSGNLLELDEYINAEIKDGVRVVDLCPDIPDYFATLNEHYFSFTTKKEGHNLLEITSNRKDVNKIFSEKGTDLLLYLPERNEQKFANKITNLHPLSEEDMGVFTDNEIWYVKTVISADRLSYRNAIKSKNTDRL